VEQNLENTMALLERTPAALDALLRGLPATWTETNEGGNTWSVRGVVVHLIHCEREDWMPRMRLILQPGELKTFAPFDREGGLRSSHGKTLEQLLDEAMEACAGSLAAEIVSAAQLVPGSSTAPAAAAPTSAFCTLPRTAGCTGTRWLTALNRRSLFGTSLRFRLARNLFDLTGLRS